MIHANESILDVQKFKYLVTSLSSNAAKIIESIELTDTNYTIAWELLEERYDDPRAIKKKHSVPIHNTQGGKGICRTDSKLSGLYIETFASTQIFKFVN